MLHRYVPILITAWVLLCATGAGAISFEEAIMHPNPQAKYLFYMHGAILEEQGKSAESPRYGTYQYDSIVKHFEDRGLTVIEEVRPKTRPPQYASKIVMQVRRLMAAGVPAGHITVSGFSKGGHMTLLVASSLGEPGVRYVVMAGCGKGTVGRSYTTFLKHKRGARLQGQLLSIYASSDLDAQSCAEAAKQAGNGFLFKEIRIKSNKGHGLFYAPLPQWVNPVAQFALGGR